jgi:hypothetical protein
MVCEWMAPEALDEAATMLGQPGVPAPVVRFVPVEDRALITVELDGIGKERPEGHMRLDEVDGAIVRVKIRCTEAQAEALHADSSARLRQLVAELKRAGAVKVVGPQMDVQRPERARSELTVDVDPARALTTWLDGQDLADRGLVEREAQRIMS